MIAALASAHLIASQRTLIRDYGLKPYVRTTTALPHREERTWKLVCRTPYNCQFQPWIEFEGAAGKSIAFDSTNPLVRYLTRTEVVIAHGGRETFEAKNWISGEGAIYTIPAGVTVRAVKFRETGFDTDFAGSFWCDDDDYNRLWTKAARTAYLCMRDHFYDCPDRERVGFWGDGTPELDQCFYLFDRRSDELCRDLVLRKHEPKFYPGQHLEFLGEYGLWFYYLHTADLVSLSNAYDGAKTFLFDTYKTGSPKTWFDWGKDVKDVAVLENCFLYSDLGALRKMATATGHAEDLAAIEARREAIRSSFDARFWRGRFYQSDQVAIPDDRANAMAILSGLADAGKWETIRTDVLERAPLSSCFFDRWIFEALIQMGRADLALTRMATRYRTMIESDVTTLWEHYDRWWASWVDAYDDASSLNHGWNPPALVLMQDVAGVRPIEPGWATYEVAPSLGFLRHVKLTVPSMRGPVRVAIDRANGAYSIAIDGPRSADVVVGVPIAAFSSLRSVELDGRRVWGPGVANARFQGEAGGYLRFRIASGNVRLVARGVLADVKGKAPRPPEPRSVRLDSHGWIATASVPDGSYPFTGAKIPTDVSAANALDGDLFTGWRDMTATQRPGQWFQVDLRRPSTFDVVELESSWAPFDYPRRFEIRVSGDARSWSEPIAQGSGSLGITRVTVPRTTARFVRVNQTASDPKYHWSIFEFRLSRLLDRR